MAEGRGRLRWRPRDDRRGPPLAGAAGEGAAPSLEDDRGAGAASPDARAASCKLQRVLAAYTATGPGHDYDLVIELAHVSTPRPRCATQHKRPVEIGKHRSVLPDPERSGRIALCFARAEPCHAERRELIYIG